VADGVGDKDEETDSLGEALLEMVRVAVSDTDPDPLEVAADVIVSDLLEVVEPVSEDDGDLVDDEELVVVAAGDEELVVVAAGDEDLVVVATGDEDGVTETATEEVGVPEAGIVATSNPITAGGTQRAIGADVSAHGRAYTPN